MSDAASELTEYKNVILTAAAEPVGDVIFLPTDISGTPGQLNSKVLAELGVDLAVIPRQRSLSAGYAVVTAGAQRFCFVVTVGIGRTDDQLRTHFASALQDERIRDASSFWIPLMGTGSGQLRLDESRLITMEVLSKTEWVRRPHVKIVISFPPRTLVDESSFPDFALERSVRSAIEYAAVMRIGLQQRDTDISTSLLFFALVGSQSSSAPNPLRDDHAASLFSGAVRSLAGERLDPAWKEYFPLRYAGHSMPQSWPAAPTSNALEVLSEAAAIARRAARRSITIEDLIESLLAHPSSRNVFVTIPLGIERDGLLHQFRDALVGQIGTMLHNDVAAVQDQLGYDAYAEAIRDFLADSATSPPLSVSIQAPWGAGKSSLMHQIRDKLDPAETRTPQQQDNAPAKRLTLRGALAFLNREQPGYSPGKAADKRLWTVWFNAWQYDSSEQLWAGLVDAIVTQISARLPPVSRELFLLRLQLSRIDDGIVRKKIYDRVVTIWWSKVRAWTLAGATAIASIFAAHAVVNSAEPKGIASGLLHTPLIGSLSGIGMAIALAFSYKKIREKTNAEPAAFSLAEYLQVPDYNRALGSIHHVHRDLLRVLEVTPRKKDTEEPSPIVVFIDDLDRCSPSKIAGVVEGVSMFLASDAYRCMFVIGIDPQMIAAALDEAHATVRGRLPVYERAVPLGWRFMDKFIQLPFTIPPSSRDQLKAFVEGLTDIAVAHASDDLGRSSSNVVTDARQSKKSTPAIPGHTGAAQTGTRADLVDTTSASLAAPLTAEETRTIESNKEASIASQAVRNFKESRDVGVLIRLAAHDTSSNPREIKRLANLARLYLGLRNSRRIREPSWRSPSISQYARWITVTLLWPDMLRWLQWGTDDDVWTVEEALLELPERRLRLLQREASHAQSAAEWTKAVVAHLGITDPQPTGWVSDPRLHRFFKAEAEMAAEEQLGAAIAGGFW
jgi:KAP family P-loop domain